MIYLYDAEGSPIGMKYRGGNMADGEFEEYWFEKNLQGDIVAVYDAAGNKHISYTYDAWGNFETEYHNGCTAFSVASYNPFLYRGYYYDTELQMYYLQSRYYDPMVGRFINADGYIYNGQGILGCNMFAYCNNNPVMFSDPTGESITISTIILIISIVAAVSVAGYTAYVEYNAGVETGQIINDSLLAGMSTFMIAYSFGMSAYQCYLNFCYLQGLTPITQIGGANNLTTQLQACANTANNQVSGTGAVAGTYKHSVFAAEVNKLGNSSIRTEVSYLNGQEVAYGTKGSIRFDVLQFNSEGMPIAAWDFKTGAATLTQSRITQMLERSGLNIPINMIKGM